MLSLKGLSINLDYQISIVSAQSRFHFFSFSFVLFKEKLAEAAEEAQFRSLALPLVLDRIVKCPI
jgi:hypothetical protein